MADGVFNIAKGRFVEMCWRVENNDPSTSGLILVVLKATGLEADSVLQDYDDLASIIAASNDEANNTGYTRVTYTDVELGALTPDDTNNRYDVDIPDPTWSSVQATGGAWGKLLVCYKPNTGTSTDAQIMPLTYHDFAVTPDGNNITGTVNTAGFARAS